MPPLGPVRVVEPVWMLPSLLTLRLISPRGDAVALSKGYAVTTREELRRFVRHLRGAGLRVNNTLRRPVAESPFQD